MGLLCWAFAVAFPLGGGAQIESARNRSALEAKSAFAISPAPAQFWPSGIVRSNQAPRTPQLPQVKPAPAPAPTAPNRSIDVLPPGVYESRPYTCIVVVPGSHPDEKVFPRQRNLGQGPRMPVITPDLQFIPRQTRPAQPPSRGAAP